MLEILKRMYEEVMSRIRLIKSHLPVFNLDTVYLNSMCKRKLSQPMANLLAGSMFN